MKLHLTTDSGQAVTLDVDPGENLWIETDSGARLGSLYLDLGEETIGLGRYSEESSWWEYSETIPTSA